MMGCVGTLLDVLLYQNIGISLVEGTGGRSDFDGVELFDTPDLEGLGMGKVEIAD